MSFTQFHCFPQAAFFWVQYGLLEPISVFSPPTPKNGCVSAECIADLLPSCPVSLKRARFCDPARCSCRMAAGYCCSPGALEYMWPRCFQARFVTRVATSRAEVGAGCQLTKSGGSWFWSNQVLKKTRHFKRCCSHLSLRNRCGNSSEVLCHIS